MMVGGGGMNEHQARMGDLDPDGRIAGCKNHT